MYVNITSCAVLGIEGYVVDVEVDLSSGLPTFEIVGLPDSAVKESRERVRAAIRNSGFVFPVKRITVNLAPADIRKSGPSFDLPIAIGILVCTGIIPKEAVGGSFFAAELSLDGVLRPINGMLAMVLAARQAGMRDFFVSSENANEARLADGINIFGATSLAEIASHFLGNPLTSHCPGIGCMTSAEAQEADFADESPTILPMRPHADHLTSVSEANAPSGNHRKHG